MCREARLSRKIKKARIIIKRLIEHQGMLKRIRKSIK